MSEANRGMYLDHVRFLMDALYSMVTKHLT